MENGLWLIGWLEFTQSDQIFRNFLVENDGPDNNSNNQKESPEGKPLSNQC